MHSILCAAVPRHEDRACAPRLRCDQVVGQFLSVLDLSATHPVLVGPRAVPAQSSRCDRQPAPYIPMCLKLTRCLWIGTSESISPIPQDQFRGNHRIMMHSKVAVMFLASHWVQRTAADAGHKPAIASSRAPSSLSATQCNVGPGIILLQLTPLPSRRGARGKEGAGETPAPKI